MADRKAKDQLCIRVFIAKHCGNSDLMHFCSACAELIYGLCAFTGTLYNTALRGWVQTTDFRGKVQGFSRLMNMLTELDITGLRRVHN